MFAQFTKNIHLQLSAHPILHGLDHWLAGQYEHHHQKHIDRTHISYLRGLDRHMLSDIGVDLKALYSLNPVIKRTP